MSASREKKQRQGAGPSEKALQAQQQEAARKQKTITYTVIGVVIAVLVAALLIWNTGFFQARATAATVGDTKLTTAELSYYYYSGIRQTYVAYSSYTGFDTSKPDDEQDYGSGEDTKTYREFFLESALSDAQQDISRAAEALKNGHTEAEVKENLDARVAAVKAQAASYNVSYSAYLQSVFGPYMSTGVYEKMVQRALLANLAYTDKGTELSESYTEADLTAYYDKDDNADTLDTFTYSYLYFTPADVETKDADGNDIDQETIDTKKELALAEAKSNADEALASLKGGSSISSLVSKYKLDDKNYADHTASVGSGRINSTFQEKLLELKDGESALVENGTSGYYVVTFHGRERVEAPTKDVRHILALAETTTDENGSVVEPTQEAWDAAKEKIEAIQAEWEAGDKTEDSFAALANEKSDDGDGTTGGLYTKIDVDDVYASEFSDWIFTDGRSVGDTGIVQHSAGDSDSNKYWGYHFMYLVGDNEPLWMRSARNALTSEALTSWQEGLNSSCATNLADGANYLGK